MCLEPWLEQVQQVGTQVTRSRVDAEGRRQVLTVGPSRVRCASKRGRKSLQSGNNLL